jgi:small-conductance mechanosensitive channel
VQDRQIDLSAKVAQVKNKTAQVKRKTRPWKSIIALLFAIAAAIISHQARLQARGESQSPWWTVSHEIDEVIAYGAATLFGILGLLATYGLAAKSRELLEPRVGTSHAAVVRYAILIIGGFATLVITLDLFAVPVAQLIVAGGLTSVFVGIAAQQALGNVFAGLVLLFARPFVVGEAIRLRAGALGGTLDGTVQEIGITYVRLDTGDSVMAIPNSQVLNAVIGPIPPPEESEAPAVPDGKSGTPGGPEQPQPAPPGPV